MLQKFDLRSVEQDNPNPRLMNATLDEGLGELAHKLCLCVLHEIANMRVACRKGVSVDKDGFATMRERMTRLNDCEKKNNLKDLPPIRDPL